MYFSIKVFPSLFIIVILSAWFCMYVDVYACDNIKQKHWNFSGFLKTKHIWYNMDSFSEVII